jgi:hypothetical protein
MSEVAFCRQPIMDGERVTMVLSNPAARAKKLGYVLFASLFLAISSIADSRAAGADNLASSGGAVMLSSTSYAIFWLPTGQDYEASGSDSRYENLLQQFLGDVGGTNYYNIVTQYNDGTGNSPTANSALGGTYVDTTAYPHSGTGSDPLTDADIQAEVTRVMNAQGWSPGLNNLYLVFTGDAIETCVDGAGGQCASNAFCAYHSWFVPDGWTQPVVYATLPDAEQNAGLCLTQGPTAIYPNGDATADSEISFVAKELLAAATDPQDDGWTDSSGAEIGDKCDWSFGTIGADGGNVALRNSHRYLLQQEWSNASASCVLGYGTLGPWYRRAEKRRKRRLIAHIFSGQPRYAALPPGNQRLRVGRVDR